MALHLAAIQANGRYAWRQEHDHGGESLDCSAPSSITDDTINILIKGPFLLETHSIVLLSGVRLRGTNLKRRHATLITPLTARRVESADVESI